MKLNQGLIHTDFNFNFRNVCILVKVGASVEPVGEVYIARLRTNCSGGGGGCLRSELVAAPLRQESGWLWLLVRGLWLHAAAAAASGVDGGGLW